MTVPSGSASLFSSLITEIKNFTFKFLYLQVGNCILQVGNCILQVGNCILQVGHCISQAGSYILWLHCLMLQFFTLFAGMIC